MTFTGIKWNWFCQVRIRAMHLHQSEGFNLCLYLHPLWWRAVACDSAADPLLFSALSSGSGVLAEQNSMASGHIGAASRTSQTPLPNKHSCSETRLVPECSRQGSAAGFDPKITGYSSVSDFWKKKAFASSCVLQKSYDDSRN